MTTYDNVNDKHKKLIIKFGEIIYNQLEIYRYKDIDSFIKNDDNINEKIKKSFDDGINMNKLQNEKYETKIKENEDEYFAKIDLLNKSIKEKDDLIIDAINNYQIYYQKGLEEGKLTNKSLLDEKEIQLTDKNELLELYRPKIYNNMKEKGDEVENIINDELIRKINRLAYTIDTSDIWGSGDRILNFPDYKMMVECKNKGTIKKSDIEQFKEHYMSDFNENKYDIALFLSYSCEYILGIGTFKIEDYNGKLVCYIGINDSVNDKNKECIIEYYITMINDLYLSNIKTDPNKERLEDHLLTGILDIYNDILIIEKYELPYIDIINQKYEKKKLKINNYINILENNNIPIPIEIQSIHGNDELFINKLIIKLKQQNKTYIPKQNWKQFLIDNLKLDQFYIKFLNKKGITRDKFEISLQSQ